MSSVQTGIFLNLTREFWREISGARPRMLFGGKVVSPPRSTDILELTIYWLCASSSPLFGVVLCIFGEVLFIGPVYCNVDQETIYWLCASSSPCSLSVLCAILGEVLSFGTDCQPLCVACENLVQSVSRLD